eukprot:jgi/Astpho2/5263/e_gw1.00074.85.1_t
MPSSKRISRGAGPLQAATSQLDAARQEAARASAAASRHQGLMARLTADNLVFLMRVNKCEQELGIAARERDELKVALEQQQGPWFDEVRSGVESRVRAALQRGQSLEAQLEAEVERHAEALAEAGQRAQLLQQEVKAGHMHIARLQLDLSRAAEATARAEEEAAAQREAASRAEVQAAEASAEHRVMSTRMLSMQRDLTAAKVGAATNCPLEEAGAMAKVAGLVSRIKALHEQVKQAEECSIQLRHELATQQLVNEQLMQRKQEVEWQLMAAVAEVCLELYWLGTCMKQQQWLFEAPCMHAGSTASGPGACTACSCATVCAEG